MRQNRINLSSRPFTNRRLFWLGILCMSALSIVSGFWMSRARANALLRISILEAQMSSRKAEVDRLKKEDEEKQQQEAKIFLSEQDSYHLAAARQLIMRRSFAWDKLVGDLERFVPKNARLVAIKISGITKDDSGVTASLELSALGKSPAEMTEMMTQFGKSEGLFEVGDAQQGEVTDTGETPFSLGLQYHPRRGGDQ
jgi:Tfp pilus assembly protein PilN